MAELIDWCRQHQSALPDLLSAMRKQLWNAKRDMELGWLCVVAGEAGREGLLALIDLLGETDSDDVTEAAIPGLKRHACDVYEDLKQALDASENEGQRDALYDVLQGAVVQGDACLKQDLADFARHRYREELREGNVALALETVRLLVCLGEPDAPERLDEVRRHCPPGDVTEGDIGEVAASLAGSFDPLELTRGVLREGWRDTAENLRKLFHPTEQEVKQLQELTASLAPPDREVH